MSKDDPNDAPDVHDEQTSLSQDEALHSTASDSVVSVDDVIEMVGHFGRYQRKHYFLVASAWIPCAFCTLSMVFVNSRPQWRTLPNGEIQNSELPCDSPGSFEVVDSQNSIRGEWGLYCDDQWQATMLNSIYFVGFGIGASVLGGLADKLGRHKTFFLAAAVCTGFSVLCVISPSVPIYALARMGVGVGVGGFGIVAFVLASEIIGHTWQASTGVAQAAIFSFGCVLLTPLAYSVRAWRVLTLLTGLSPLLFLALYRTVEESPRWLQLQGRVDEAMVILQHIGAANGAPISDDLRLATPQQSDAPPPGLSELFDGVLKKRAIYMLFIWFSNSFVYYGLSLNSGNLGGSLYFNFALGSCIELISMPVGAWLTDKIGRVKTLSGAMILSGIACAAVMMLPEGLLTTGAAMLGKFGITASFAIIFVYAAELFPTVVRSLAMGLSSTAARVGGVMAPGVVFLSGVSKALPLLVFGVFAFAAGILLLGLPETMGKPLPETIEDCERDVSGSEAHVELEEIEANESAKHDDL